MSFQHKEQVRGWYKCIAVSSMCKAFPGTIESVSLPGEGANFLFILQSSAPDQETTEWQGQGLIDATRRLVLTARAS